MKLVLTALILLATSTSFAGNAANDPVVSSLRARFSKAFVPTAQQLQVGKTWDCRDFEAFPGTSVSTSNNRTFRSFDGLFEMTYNNRDYNFTYVATPQGLVSTGMYEAIILHTIIRVDGKNNLLIEESAKVKETADKSIKAEYAALDKAIALDGQVVLRYNVCVVKAK